MFWGHFALVIVHFHFEKFIGQKIDHMKIHAICDEGKLNL
jgi:hypothetical protein